MELNERKEKILDAIIRNYLETGEPVGSRTISKNSDLNLSSATIRNEMSDLEEDGFIVQPHTSSGRIPTDKGYRFYVDHMLKQIDEREKKVSEREELIIEKMDKVDAMMENMAKVLANNTNYATMVTTPKSLGNKIKFVQLSLLEDKQLLLTVVSDKNRVINKILDVEEDERHTITLDDIIKGFKIVRDKYPHFYKDIMEENYDLIGADAVIQCAVFDEVVYG